MILRNYDPNNARSSRVRVILPNLRMLQNFEGEAEPDVLVRLKNYNVLWRYALYGADGFAEAYIREELDIEGDLALRKLNQMNGNGARSLYSFFPPALWLRNFILEWRTSNRTFEQARRNAIFHYNHPRAFYEFINGTTMGYTENYLVAETDDIDTAQRQKFEHIARKLFLKPGQKVVEVGTGCGYLACLMAKKYGVDVTNYGLVPMQNDILEEMKREWGVEDRVRNVVRDHRELQNEPDTYDRYVSVGVYEHAGKGIQEEWIRSIATCLKHGGVGFISCLGFAKQVTNGLFINTYIFPGTNVPSLSEMLLWMEKNNLHVVDIENLWYHYARALEMWAIRFNTHWPEIQKLDPARYTERFRRTWQVYLEGLSAIFSEGEWGVDLYHITFTKGKHKDFYPLTRDFIYSAPDNR